MNETMTICGMFDRPRMKALKKAYNKAVAENKDTFVFEGGDYVVSFAKYLIEHLEGVLT